MHALRQHPFATAARAVQPTSMTALSERGLRNMNGWRGAATSPIGRAWIVSNAIVALEVNALARTGWCSVRIHAAGGLLAAEKSDRAMSHDRQLHALGQSLWLDNISRRMLDDGTLARYVSDLSVTGLTSNPSIFEKAI